MLKFTTTATEEVTTFPFYYKTPAWVGRITKVDGIEKESRIQFLHGFASMTINTFAAGIIPADAVEITALEFCDEISKFIDEINKLADKIIPETEK